MELKSDVMENPMTYELEPLQRQQLGKLQIYPKVKKLWFDFSQWMLRPQP